MFVLHGAVYSRPQCSLSGLTDLKLVHSGSTLLNRYLLELIHSHYLMEYCKRLQDKLEVLTFIGEDQNTEYFVYK